MRLGFVDAIYNRFDVFEGVQALSSEKLANVQFDRLTVPDVLKVPAGAKRLLDQGADVVLVFLTVGEDDRDALYLIYEKTIDVEIATGKFVVFCTVSDDEWRNDEDFKAVADKKLGLALQLVSKTVTAPASLAQDIGSDAFAAFAQMSAAATGASPEEEKTEAGGVGSLF